MRRVKCREPVRSQLPVDPHLRRPLPTPITDPSGGRWKILVRGDSSSSTSFGALQPPRRKRTHEPMRGPSGPPENAASFAGSHQGFDPEANTMSPPGPVGNGRLHPTGKSTRRATISSRTNWFRVASAASTRSTFALPASCETQPPPHRDAGAPRENQPSRLGAFQSPVAHPSHSTKDASDAGYSVADDPPCRLNHSRTWATLAARWLGRAPIPWEAPGTRTSAVSTSRSLRA